MLIQFNFNNFKSYKMHTSLDMTATSLKEYPHNLITSQFEEQYVKVAAIYGANASGKTAVIDAFDFMRFFVLTSFRIESEGRNIPLRRFAFDKASRAGKSEFEVFFSYRDQEYQYGFTLDNKKIYEEWLYKRDYRGKSKYNTLFERKNEKLNCSKLFNEACKFTELVEESTLFLSLISNTKIKDAKIVYEWFQNTEVIDFGNTLCEGYISSLLPIDKLKDSNYRHKLENFLRAIDVGIDGIRIEKLTKVTDDEGKPVYKVYARHKTEDSHVEIPFSEESSGTQKMFCLYHFLHETLERGHTLFIDELDAKVHPLLLRYIINMFHNPDINKHNAQLVYTTHDVYTLAKEIFRRDQIWFTDKDEQGVSSLYSLAEYKLDNQKKVRNDATYNKDYLAGRYGAVPDLQHYSSVSEDM